MGKEKTVKISEILEKHFNDEDKKEDRAAKKGAVPKQTSKQSKNTAKDKSTPAQKAKSRTPEKKIAQEVKIVSKPTEIVKGKSPTPSKNKKKNKNKNKSKSVIENEPLVEVAVEKASTLPSQEMSKPIQIEQKKPVKTAEQIKKDIAAYL